MAERSDPLAYLEDQGRLPDAGIAADQGDRSDDDAAAQDAVELADADDDARPIDGLDLGDGDGFLFGEDGPPGAFFRPGNLFDERVEFAALAALPHPLRRARAARLAHELDFGLRHRHPILPIHTSHATKW